MEVFIFTLEIYMVIDTQVKDSHIVQAISDSDTI